MNDAYGLYILLSDWLLVEICAGEQAAHTRYSELVAAFGIDRVKLWDYTTAQRVFP